MKYRTLCLSLLVIAMLPVGGESLRAATFNIANGDVAALKAALTASNTNGLDDIINLAAGGVYTLTTVDNTTGGATGLPVIVAEEDRALTINGNGATIQRSSAGATPTFRIFYITCYSNSCASEPVTFNDLTVTGGAAVSSGGENGGAFDIFNGEIVLSNCVLTGNTASMRGGAIYNGGKSLSLDYCTLSNNEGHDGGGAIANSSTLNAYACTFSANHATAGPAGGLYNHGRPATATLTNCTFDNNTRTVAGGTSAGGIFNVIFVDGTGADVSKINFTHCTFRQSDLLNSGQYTGGPAPTGIMTVRNCIFSDSDLVNDTNPGHDRVHIDSGGYNLSSDDGGGNLTGPNDQINTNPKLDPAGLQNNGGATATIALLAESPALDHGNSFGINFDQRDQFRPRDLTSVPNGPGSDGADVGAFEAIEPIQGGPNFVVNVNADHDDGVCSVSDCTLREAVSAANAATNANTISFAPTVTGTITLNSALGQLVVSNPVTINGPGARTLAISGGSAVRVFNFSSGSSVLSNLTIRDGRVVSLLSGGSATGSGLSNSGTLIVNDCAFVSNQALGGNSSSAGGTGGSGRGGAIGNILSGVLTLNRCTFSGNSVTGGKGGNNTGAGIFGGTGGAGQGGALLNDPSCTLAINNCTFANNTATGGVGGNNTSTDGHGGTGGAGSGAIFNREATTITASTVSGNTGAGGAGGQGSVARNDGNSGQGSGGLENSGSSSFTVRNTISAGNNGNGADAKGAFVSQGYNLIGIGDFASGFTGTEDQVGSNAAPINAKLGPLQNNTGPTDTMATLADSPAVDQGKSFGLTTDQRGQLRPRDNPLISNATGGDGSEIGAFEFGGVIAVTTVDDHNDGVCNAADCTLREAINAANSQTGDEIIAFAPGLNGTIQLSSALPGLSTNMTLQGPGVGKITVRRNTGGDYRIFIVSNGTNSGPVVSISGLTLANGKAPAGSYPLNSGGGILNDHATLTLSDCVVTGNSSEAGNLGYGGGLLNNEGTLIVTKTTLSANSSFHGAGIGQRSLAGSSSTAVSNSTFNNNTAGSGFGGGFYNGATNSGSGASFSLTNCTLSGNDASAGFGGGIYNAGATSGNGSADLTNCTLSGNSAGTGGGIYNFNSSGTASLTMRNNIFKTGASGANLANSSGTIISHGSNLSDDAAGGAAGTGPGGFLNATGDIRNTNPQLAALASNGGPTKTIALLTNSPAINNGDNANSPARDQRNFVRPDAADIGAFEFNAAIPNTLANISTRAFVQTGDNVMIGGFILSGTGVKKVMIRAIGPSLAPFGITNPLQNPTLELHDASGVIAINDNWGDAANHQAITDSGLAPGSSQESAILMNLNPGNYTAIVKGVNNGTGIALFEGYDLDRPTASKFGNISTRALVQTGDNVMIGGFIVKGPDLEAVIMRAIGPSLTPFGIVNAMADPMLEIHNGNGTLIASNDNWKDAQQSQIQATGFAPSQDAESAIVQTLAPGNYTAIVKGKNDTSGVALVEVYGLN